MAEITNLPNPHGLKLYLGEDGLVYDDEECTKLSDLKVDGVSINSHDPEYREYIYYLTFE